MAAPPGAAAFEPAGGDEGVEDAQHLHTVDTRALPEVGVGNAASSCKRHRGLAQVVGPAARDKTAPDAIQRVANTESISPRS